METLREFLGFGIVEFTDFIIQSIFLLFTIIVISAILIIRYKEIRHEKKQVKAIIDNAQKVEKVEGLLKQYQKSGFRDLEQLAIDVVKICNRKASIIALFLLFSGLISAQEYSDPFSDSRAPYRFRIYEREVLAANEIDRVDTLNVWKYLNVEWMQGLYKFEGDTSKLIFSGWQRDIGLCDTLGRIVYPAYYYLDTIYILPTLKGFELWKQAKGYN